MNTTRTLFVRSRGWLPFLGKSKEPDAAHLSKEQQESLRNILPNLRVDSVRDSEKHLNDVQTDDVLDSRINMDSIRARGVMKYTYEYNPPDKVEDLVKSVSSKYLGVSVNAISGTQFSNNEVKAKILLDVGSELTHFPTNSRLVYLKTVQDVIDFYNEPVHNKSDYISAARSTTNPKNVNFMEQPVRFHPEDVEAWHGGVTAFPGSGGQVLGLRNKRLIRQFTPKKDWFDYEDQSFDYQRPDKDMPWDPEIAAKMDRYPDKRYNLDTKRFNRSK